MLVASSQQPNHLVRLMPAAAKICGKAERLFENQAREGGPLAPLEPWSSSLAEFESSAERPCDQGVGRSILDTDRLLYLTACQAEWKRTGDPSAAWEIISASRSAEPDLRAHALSLLERLQPNNSSSNNETSPGYEHYPPLEASMRTPYGLEIIESCMGCKASQPGFFCHLSTEVLRTVDLVSHHTVMPAAAVLFIEGQSPRGIFIVCHGSVKLSTTSKEGKVLILKQAGAGEVLGLSAVISGTNYEMTVETASACQLNFIGRRDFMGLLQRESEIGMHAAMWLSREFQSAYRDIHDLVLARSSSGKLARLLLSCVPLAVRHEDELHLRSAMTHEEMAQRIGSSRETVTRLLSDLKKKRLIRLEGATLVIRDRSALEALAV